MANLQFKGFYTTQDIVSFVVAGAADTPGVTASNPIFDATVDWGSGGQQNIRYTASSGNGIVISDKKVNLIHTDNTNSSSPEIKYYGSTGLKLVSITGGWKNALNDTDSYLALPKQSVSRYGSNVFLNNKKGDLSMTADQSDLVFKFSGDYIGLRSSDGIKLVKGQKYSIPSNDFNFRLESNSHLDAVYSDGELDTKTESGFLQYFYDIDGVTYSSEFEIVDSVDTSIAPALSEWDGMLTQRYSVDESAYDIFTFHGNSINPMNKRKAFRINLGTDFGLHGVGDFANYGMQRVENMSGHTQSFSGAIDHMFAGCTNFKFSSVISNMNLNGITSMLGFMSGCSSYVEHFKLNNITASVLTDLTGCFEYSAYKAVNIKNWDVSQVTSVESFLESTTYNRAGISENWNTSNVTSFKSMFKNNSHFKQYLGGIDVSSAQSMEGMFHNAKEYNGYSAQWNVSNVSSFANMFRGASSFNKPISKWKTGSATSMKGMFCNASSFNKTVWAQPGTERWDTSNVESFESMFEGSSFGESTKSWNIGKVKSFKNMFKNNTGFNYQLPTWGGQFGENLAENEKSIDFTGMFESSVFNQPVKGWNVSSAISVKNMFKDNTEFNSQLFPGWKLKGTKCENVTNFLCGTTALSAAVKSASTSDLIKDPLKTYGNTLKNCIGFPLMFCTDDSAMPDELKSNTYKTYRSAWESENLFEVGGEEPPEPLPNEVTCVNDNFDNWISFDTPVITINENGSTGKISFSNFTVDSSQAPHSCVDTGTMYAFIVKRGYSSDSLATSILYSITSLDSNVYGWGTCSLIRTSDDSFVSTDRFTSSNSSTAWVDLDTSSSNFYSSPSWTVNTAVTQSFSSWLGSDNIDIIFQSVGIDYTADTPEVVMFNDTVQADTVQLVAPETPVRPSISRHGGHLIYLNSDGTVQAKGTNWAGQLGDGTTNTSETSFVDVDIDDIVQVDTGSGFTVYLKSDGTVWAAGYNSRGQLGDGTTTSRSNPVQVKNSDGTAFSDVIQISTGNGNTFYLKSDGTV